MAASDRVEIARTLSGYQLVGFPDASVIRRARDSSLTQLRVAFFEGVLSEPISRNAVLECILRDAVFGALKVANPQIAASLQADIQTRAPALSTAPPGILGRAPAVCKPTSSMVSKQSLAKAMAELLRIGLVLIYGPESNMRNGILASEGHMSFAGRRFLMAREGNAIATSRLHWPGGESGVTLGYGYDMKLRGDVEVGTDLSDSGVDASTAAAAAMGAGLKYDTAKQFAKRNRNAIQLNEDQKAMLFTKILPDYEGRVRRVIHEPLATGRLLTCEFDALVSMVFQGVLRASEPVAGSLRTYNFEAAATGIVLQTDPAWLSRRLLEQQLFNRSVYSQ